MENDEKYLSHHECFKKNTSQLYNIKNKDSKS